MSIENPRKGSTSPHADYAEKQPMREQALQESIFPKAEVVSQKEIWDVSVEELQELREELRTHNMGPSRLARGELANVIDRLTLALGNRRSMLDGEAQAAFRAFKKEIEDIKPFATGAF